MPSSWSETVFVPILKKDDEQLCKNFLDVSYKVFVNMLNRRLKEYEEETIGEHLCGFICN